MAYDLLNMKGDIFKYESETQGGAYLASRLSSSHFWSELFPCLDAIPALPFVS